MDSNEEQLNILHQKVQQLVKQYGTLQRENISLKKDLEKQTMQAIENMDQVKKLQKQLDSLNLSSHVWDADDKKSLQKRIDAYLKEIDICLQLLNN